MRIKVPAIEAVTAPITKAMILYLVVFTPTDSAVISFSRTAIVARPGLEDIVYN